MGFYGFPKGVMTVPAPAHLFNVLLEEIDDLAELKVTLRIIWLLNQRRGKAPWVNESELINDLNLLRGLKFMGGDPQERIRYGLGKAAQRRTLLRFASAERPGQAIYLLNNERGQRELRRLKSGEAAVPRDGRDEWAEGKGTYYLAADEITPPLVEGRPNIFALYEDNIGTIGPVIAEELQAAEQRYPESWISEAFKIAIHENKRSWSYISAILRRWAADGRGGLREEKVELYPESGVGRKAGAPLWKEDEVKHGEPGRYTPANN